MRGLNGIPEVSPDGRYVLYLGFSANLQRSGVQVARFSDGEPVHFEITVEKIRSTSANMGRAHWMPDGRSIAFLGQDLRLGSTLMPMAEARREAEELLATFGVLYPNDSVVRTALRGAAMYELSWSDAHVWAYAEVYGLSELWSEDFQHDRRYGTVRVVNPFL